MKITRIFQQAKIKDRYSVFVDGAYAFSLSESALLKSQLVPGQELTVSELEAWKRQSADDKVYGRALRYAAFRLRSVWEMERYLQRMDASPSLATKILSKLSDIRLLNDDVFAKSFVENRNLLRPSSKLKLQQELRAKHIADEIIGRVLGDTEGNELAALRKLIRKKGSLPKFKADKQKFMQYLARQGFGYDAIKTLLGEYIENE